MHTKLRFALAALTAAVLGLQPAFAQQPEAEVKKAQEQLEKLLKELKDLKDKEAKQAETLRAKERLQAVEELYKAQDAAKAAQKPVPPTPPAPPAPPKPTANAAWTQLHNPANDLKTLAASKDPKVAAMAKELLEHLNKAAPQAGKPLELHLELVKPAASGNGGTFEFRVAPLADAPKPAAGANTFEFRAAQPDMFKVLPAKPGTADLDLKVVPFPSPATANLGEKVERRVVVIGDGPNAKPVEGRIVVAGEKIADPAKTVTVTAIAHAPARGTSTLKLSADGKTAALLAADGTITIFDVASGKEMMKFSGKK